LCLPRHIAKHFTGGKAIDVFSDVAGRGGGVYKNAGINIKKVKRKQIRVLFLLIFFHSMGGGNQQWISAEQLGPILKHYQIY
jgi:hypothetical protein